MSAVLVSVQISPCRPTARSAVTLLGAFILNLASAISMRITITTASSIKFRLTDLKSRPVLFFRRSLGRVPVVTKIQVLASISTQYCDRESHGPPLTRGPAYFLYDLSLVGRCISFRSLSRCQSEADRIH